MVPPVIVAADSESKILPQCSAGGDAFAAAGAAAVAAVAAAAAAKPWPLMIRPEPPHRARRLRGAEGVEGCCTLRAPLGGLVAVSTGNGCIIWLVFLSFRP